MLVEQAAGAARRPRRRPRPATTTCRFRWASTRRGDPVKAYVTIIEGCNEFCSFCVVPYTRGHERMRPKADILAEVREAAATGRREVQLLGQIVNHYAGARRPGVRLRRRCSRRFTRSPGIERIRFASPHPRHVTPRFLDAMARLPKVCRHLHLPVQSGSTRVLEAMRRRYTRESYLELVGAIRDRLPDVALSTDMIVGFPGRDRRGLRGDAVADRARSATTACSRSSTRRGRTRWPRSGCPTMCREEEKTRRIVALQALQREIQTALNERLVGQEVDGAGRRGEPAARRRSSRGGRAQNVVVNLPGPAEWIGRTVAGARRARRAAQRLGRAVDSARQEPSVEAPCRSR